MEVLHHPDTSIQPTLDRRAVDRILPWLDRHRWWFFAGIVVLYAAAFNGQWRMEPDGALYLSIGRNLASGQGYTYHGQPHHLAYPGLPYLLAATFVVFGDGNLWPAHVVMVLSALAVLTLTYALIKSEAGRPTAVMVTCLLAATITFYSYAFQLRNDMPFVVGVMMFLLGFERIWGSEPRENSPLVSWSLLVLGLFIAVVMRPAMWALLPAVLATVAWSALRGRVRWGLVIAAILLLAAVAAFWALDPRRSGGAHFSGDYEVETVNEMTHGLGTTLHRVILQNVPKMFDSIVAETIFGHEWGPGANQILGITIVAMGVGLSRRRVLWGLWVACTTLMMLVVLPNNAILPRYLLPVLPFLVYAWWLAIVWLNKRLPRPWDWIFVILFVITLTINGVKIGDCIREQRHAPFLAGYKNGRYMPIDELAARIHENVEPNAIVLVETKLGRILSYYSQRRVVEAFEVSTLDLRTQPLYVVEPMDPALIELMKRHHLYAGEKIARVRQPAADAPSLVLRRVTNVAPNAPTSRPEMLGDASW